MGGMDVPIIRKFQTGWEEGAKYANPDIEFCDGYAGSWVDIMGYPYFFSLTALLGLPVLILIIWISKVAPVKN